MSKPLTVTTQKDGKMLAANVNRIYLQKNKKKRQYHSGKVETKSTITEAEAEMCMFLYHRDACVNAGVLVFCTYSKL